MYWRDSSPRLGIKTIALSNCATSGSEKTFRHMRLAFGADPPELINRLFHLSRLRRYVDSRLILRRISRPSNRSGQADNNAPGRKSSRHSTSRTTSSIDQSEVSIPAAITGSFAASCGHERRCTQGRGAADHVGVIVELFAEIACKSGGTVERRIVRFANSRRRPEGKPFTIQTATLSDGDPCCHASIRLPEMRHP